jgi:hypothetical protein
MKLKTHTYVTPRNNEKVRVWKEASRNCTLQKIFCFRLCDTIGSLKSRISPNIIIQIRSIKGYRPEGRFSSTMYKNNSRFSSKLESCSPL